MLFLAAVLALSPADNQGPDKPGPADFKAMERILKDALPEQVSFVSAKTATFAKPAPALCWLVTLEAKKAGDFTLAVETDHDPALPNHKSTKYQYPLSIGADGAKRSVADWRAVPNCCVGDKLIVPIPVERGDHNHRVTIERPSKLHKFGHERAESVLKAEDEKPNYKIDNKAAGLLRVVKADHAVISRNRSLSGNFIHTHAVILEATKPGKIQLQAPIEVVAADAKLTAWAGAMHLTRNNAEGKGKGRGYVFAGPPQWTMRVGDRLKLDFRQRPSEVEE